MSTVPVEQEALDAWARFAEAVRVGALNIRSDVACSRREKAQEALTDLHLQGAAALVSLHAAGALLPAGRRSAEPVPLDLLDTPANRRLARALREAYEAAVEVDRERGTFDPDEPMDGPTAAPIVELLAAVELEVYGPTGRGEGASPR